MKVIYMLAMAAVLPFVLGADQTLAPGGFSRTIDTISNKSVSNAIGSCCAASMPPSCQQVILNTAGQTCSSLLTNSVECTQCCSDLYAAGKAKSTYACCPNGICGNSIGCEPVSGDCGCRELSYFSGQIENCVPLEGHCYNFRECCQPNACIGNVCSTCIGRNIPCTQSSECCGSDLCINNFCAACGNLELPSCATSDQCCGGHTCQDGNCVQCTPLFHSCTNNDQCCSVTPYYSTAFCAFNSNNEGICSPCMTPDFTSDSANNCQNDVDCCGANICIAGRCTPCLLQNMTGCYENADCCSATCPAPDNSNKLICYEGLCELCYPTGSDCSDSSQCCQGACLNGYCECVGLSGLCAADTECCGDAICKNEYCCHTQVGESCTKPSDCCGQNLRCQQSTYTCQLCHGSGTYCKHSEECCSEKCYQGYCQ